MAQRQSTPWWLDAGTAVCTCCGHSHVYEIERRCAGCDAALCVFCGVQDTQQRFYCSVCERKAMRKSNQWRHARSGKAT